MGDGMFEPWNKSSMVHDRERTYTSSQDTHTITCHRLAKPVHRACPDGVVLAPCSSPR
eukprot:m.58181 g.58181  ORF g.58181 m.58181 type:complete len:58 (+) comp7811_c0_seq1:89-262(+)